MLSTLPAEIVYRIVTFLPTASALASLSQTCRRLHEVITSEDSRIYRAFVRSRFPSIETPSFWKDAAQALTSRARALDRHAIICRFVIPPPDVTKVGIHQYTRHDRPTVGYRPVIDSHECWTGGRWADRREVLAWGAGPQLAMRISTSGNNAEEQWFLFNDLDHIDSYDDICGLHLLRPEHPNKEPDSEHLIFGRKRGNPVHIAISPQQAAYEYKQTFRTDRTQIEMTDLGHGAEPILAVLSHSGSVTFFHTTTKDLEVLPFAVLEGGPGTTWAKYCKFLSCDSIAVGTGIPTEPLLIYSVTPDEVSKVREISLDMSDLSGLNRGAHITAIAPFGTADQMSKTFLAGWCDSKVRYVWPLLFCSRNNQHIWKF
jgi:F-box-like